MFGKSSPEVLVVGAGPVGLFTALSLVRRGVRVQVIDREWRTGEHSYALALHAESQRILEDAGLPGNLWADAYRIRSVGLFEGNQRHGVISLADAANEAESLAVLRQDVLERLLEDALGREGVSVSWNHELAELQALEGGVRLTIDQMEKESLGYATAHTEWVVANSFELRPRFIIGADGHRSAVRRLSGIEFTAAAAPTHFAVFEFHTSAELEREMRVVMSDRCANVLWPMPDGYCRWSFQLAEFDASEEPRTKERVAVQVGRASFPVLSEESLRNLISQRAPWFEGSIDEIKWRMVVRFEHRLATVFGRQQVWLAGDAGHTTGPVGMQSMNVGLREARDLASVVAGIVRDGQPEEQLQQYNGQRLAEWRFLLGLEGSLQPAPETDPWIAQHRNRLLSCIPASGLRLRELAGQLGLVAVDTR